MRPLSGSHSKAEHSYGKRGEVAHFYSELLAAHEHATTHGQPLLTEVGIFYVRQQLLPTRSRRTPQANIASAAGASLSTGSLPHWDSQSRRLWLGGLLVKEFRQLAPNQTCLLDVFQEQGWATAHIDDPLPSLPGETEESAKQRLQETIKNLNRGLLPGTIRFRGDGTGQGVRWEYDRRPVSKT